MSDAPEKIWASFRNWKNPHEGHCYMTNSAGGSAYIRADIHEAALAEKDALIERLRAQLEYRDHEI